MTEQATPLPHWLSDVRAEQLDDFVAWVDRTGGLEQPGFEAIQRTFVYRPTVEIDQSLDPFGDAYFEQMLALYEELSGRGLDQETGEMTRFDISDHVPHANPYASDNVRMMSGHVNAITAAIQRAELPAGAKVADLGCGWGMTSEILTFCGARVTAVDINADFVSLVRQRAKRLGNGIEAVQSNFDDLALPQEFDAVFFYECLHHAVKPWETLAQVAGFLKPGGKVFFAGEPINELWWQHWGLRLDASAVYCIRKHGWFESGWSADFLREMFARMGWTLILHPRVGLNGGDVGVAFEGQPGEEAPAPHVLEEVAEADTLRAALAETEQQRDEVARQRDEVARQRDHARRYPWKYLRSAWEERRRR